MRNSFHTSFHILRNKQTMTKLLLLAVGLLFFCHVAVTSDQGHVVTSDAENDLNAYLELVELDLADTCDDLTEARVNFWTGGRISVGSMIEADVNYARVQYELSEKLFGNETSIPANLRKIAMLRKPGDALLNTQNYTSISKFKWEINDIMYRNETKGSDRLATSRNAEELLDVWTQVEGTLQPFQGRFLPNLDMVRAATEANGEDDAESYWLLLSEYSGSYKRAEELWTRVEPLYSKLHGFARNQLRLWYGEKEVPSETTIPAHLLGSLLGADWTNIADLLTADHGSYEYIQQTLQTLGYGGRTAYEKGLGLVKSLGAPWALGEDMWQSSVFDAACPSHVFHYFGSPGAVVVTCQDATWGQFVDAHEHMMSIASQPEDQEMLFKRGPRYSALLEALSGVAATLVATPQYLREIGLVVDQTKVPDLKTTLLLLQAVHIVPRLPYYLAVDLWRLHLIENNITGYKEAEEAWISFRGKFQKVTPFLGSEKSKTLSDILADPYVSSNKPYLSKFLGSFLQFQILEKIFEFADTEGSDTPLKIIGKDVRYHKLMTIGTSQDWKTAIKDVLGIEAVDAAPLVRHFQPLESYLSAPIVKDKKHKPIKPPVAKGVHPKEGVPAAEEKLEAIILTETRLDKMEEDAPEHVGDTVTGTEPGSEDTAGMGKDPPTTTVVAAFGVSALLAASGVIVFYVVGRRFYRAKFQYNAVHKEPEP